MDFTLRLDPFTRDITFDDAGLLETIEGDDATVQNVNVNLNTWRGEFLLDQTHGTEYERIMGRAARDVLPGEAEEVIRDGVLQESKVALITGVAVNLDAGRTLSAHVTGELASGGNLDTEVESVGG